MKRKIISIILTGLIIFSLIPIKAYADDTVAKPSSEILTEVNVSEEVEATKAFMNRICLLVFSKSIPKENQDPNLSEKLWAEAGHELE